MGRDYYLSELAVSDKHGLGLTLQRIVGSDLDRVDRFVHPHASATEGGAIVARYAERQLNLHETVPASAWAARWDRWLSAGLIARIPRLGPRVQQGRRRLAERARRAWVKRAITHLEGTLDLAKSRWLVSPQQILSMEIMNGLNARHSLRYVTWIMDDHFARWKKGWSYRRGYEPVFRQHLQGADRVLVISPAMGEFYRNRFGVSTEVLFGPADPQEEPVWDSPSPGQPLGLAYFGSVYPWQHDALVRLAHNLERLDATLDVFAFRALPPELHLERVRVRPIVPADQVLAKMRAYDGVVIPASFKDEIRNLTELNFATKMSECYACGTVPVFVAPEYAAMVRFARRHGGAAVISDFNSETEVKALRAIKQSEVRRRLLREALDAAKSECSNEVMRRRWKVVWR